MDALVRLIEELKLVQQPDESFVGKVGGYPLLLKVIDPGPNCLLLFQIRCPGNCTEEQLNSQLGPELGDNLNSASIKFECGEKMVWLTVVDGEASLDSGIVGPVLLCTLQALDRLGFESQKTLCHYCQKVAVDGLTVNDGRVALICPACLEERLPTSAPRQQVGSSALLVGVVVCALGALLGALSWVLAWLGYEKFFDIIGERYFFVPRILAVFVILGFAFAVGGPGGWLIKRVGVRPPPLAVCLAGASSLLAVAVGEGLFVDWLIYRHDKLITFFGGFKILPSVYGELDGFYLFLKLLCAATGVGVAISLVKPKPVKIAI